MSQKFALCLRYVPEIRLPISILFPFFVLFSCQFFKNTSVNLFLMISGPHLVLRKQLPILWPLFLKVQISFSAICAFILSQKGRGFFPAFCTRDNPGYTEASAPAARVRRPETGGRVEPLMSIAPQDASPPNFFFGVQASCCRWRGMHHSHSGWNQGLSQAKPLLGAHPSISTLGWQLKMTLQ